MNRLSRNNALKPAFAQLVATALIFTYVVYRFSSQGRVDLGRLDTRTTIVLIVYSVLVAALLLLIGVLRNKELFMKLTIAVEIFLLFLSFNILAGALGAGFLRNLLDDQSIQLLGLELTPFTARYLFVGIFVGLLGTSVLSAFFGIQALETEEASGSSG